MKMSLPVLAVLAMLPGCATTTVKLDIGKAYNLGQNTLLGSQQVVKTVCSQPKRPAQCPAAIDLLHKGALAEDAAFTAWQAGHAADLQTALTTLLALPAQLAALGILEDQ